MVSYMRLENKKDYLINKSKLKYQAEMMWSENLDFGR